MKNFSLKDRFASVIYTLKHKRAFLTIEKKLRGKNTIHGYLHDADKLFLYLVPWLCDDDVQKIHRLHNKHHIEDTRPKSEEDLLDAVMDWECARMTKPDKPLNAYDTLMKFYPEHKEEYLPIICKYLPEQIRK